MRRLLLRVIGCALIVAGIAGSAAFLGQPVGYRALVRVSARDTAQVARLRQAAWVLDELPLFSRALEASGIESGAWQELLNRLQAGWRGGESGIEIYVEQRNEADAVRLASATAAAFTRYLSDVSQPPATTSRGALPISIARLERAIDELRSKLTVTASDPTSGSGEFEEKRRQFATVTNEMTQRRSELTVLRSQDVARAELNPQRVEAALRNDEMLQQDSQELERNAAQYRTELLLGLDRMPEPLEGLADALHGLVRVLNEQIELKPPAPLRAALEQSQVDARTLDDRRAAFAGKWTQNRQQVAELTLGIQAGALLEKHAALLEGIGQLLAAFRELIDQMRVRMDELARSGGTRETVVSSVVRGNLGSLEERVRAAADTAATLDAGRNFRIDAAERLVRGLLARMREREQLLRRQLQEQAEQQASQIRESSLRTLAERLGQLEQTRESLLEALLKELDALMHSAAESMEDQQIRGQILALEAELQQARAEFAAATPGDLRSIDVICGSPQVEQTLGRSRLFNAVLVGAAALVMTGLAGAVVLAGGKLE